MNKAVDVYMARIMLLLENKNLRNQMLKFIVTGFCGLFSDVAVYRLLVQLGIHVTPAKALGCVTGTVVVFFINRAWTFSTTQRSMAQIFRFALLYGSTIVLNTTLNTLALRVVPNPWQVAFVFATAITTMINFVGLKFVVFKPRVASVVTDADLADFSDSSPDTVGAP